MPPSIELKSHADLEAMRRAGVLAASILDLLSETIAVGVSTGELDRVAHQAITDAGAIPAPLNYKGFPKSICTSINSVICHGIPSDDVLLKDGDMVNCDVTVILDGWHGDTSRMYGVGSIKPHAQKLADVTRECMVLGINTVKPGAKLGDIGAVIEQHARQHYYSVVRDFCGHGIGRGFHEAPEVLHFGRHGTGITLKPGMVFTIEPMINAGKAGHKMWSDGWTAETIDRRLSAQWEHTIAVTETGREVLTRGKHEDIELAAT